MLMEREQAPSTVCIFDTNITLKENSVDPFTAHVAALELQNSPPPPPRQFEPCSPEESCELHSAGNDSREPIANAAVYTSLLLARHGIDQLLWGILA